MTQRAWLALTLYVLLLSGFHLLQTRSLPEDTVRPAGVSEARR